MLLVANCVFGDCMSLIEGEGLLTDTLYGFGMFGWIEWLRHTCIAWHMFGKRNSLVNVLVEILFTKIWCEFYQCFVVGVYTMTLIVVCTN